MGEFTGKRVVITGGALGIGFATAEIFVKAGARVAILEIEESYAQGTLSRLGGEAADVLFLPCDVSDALAVEKNLAVLMERFSGIDILVNVAGWELNKPFLDTTWDEYRAVMDENVGGAFLVSREVARLMIGSIPADNTSMCEAHRRGAEAQAQPPVMVRKSGGVIINVAGALCRGGHEGYALYQASKAALIALTRSMAAELLPYGIRVNSVSPGFVLSPGLRVGLRGTGNEEKALREFKEKQPLKRYGMTQEIARTIMAACGGDFAFAWGSDILVDGGYTLA
ncbi:SDR family NAD(P)-dependent oxidoreductase [Parasphaerochaeta coccoides]|uniref:3-oxoacyl-(Acyl-carrier-protein) reductase n=1 Tax=Parasphaerochaeta coccoides (strain ATCC BAA-1237 / DSM 17374 / SPN1) TaxID=760011 RepID=F4GJ73_PARC1|nr:SDR family oxidoreductase [Parasphaerochaeta coccoides]AEC01713.1 3-oxoacyl-(acyl-carrier-protein) reductase [Parasphaerochaeta coccoides DSM 17374]